MYFFNPVLLQSIKIIIIIIHLNRVEKPLLLLGGEHVCLGQFPVNNKGIKPF